MKDYFKIKEGQEINSLQKIYLTHTTIMKNLIDSESYDNMMIEVCKDIYENDQMIEIIKKLRRKDRIFLGKIIYNWSRYEWNNHPALPQRTYSYSKVFPGLRTIDFNPYYTFLKRFKEAFHFEVYNICEYEYKAKQLFLTINKKKNTYNITLHESLRRVYNFDDVFGRMVVKYKEKQNLLIISYIENIKRDSKHDKLTPQRFRVELFKGVLKIKNKIIKEIGIEPKIKCNKKYEKLFKEAKERGYLDDVRNN